MSHPNLRREVYSCVREAAKRGEAMTIDAVAAQTGAARSSVAKVAVQLGYKGWSDFTTQLKSYYSPDKLRDSEVVQKSAQAIASMLRKAVGIPVFVDAIGDAEICVDYLLVRLGELGLFAMPYSLGALNARPEGEGGVLIVINESGMALLPPCIEAGKRGYDVIAITASHDTPVSKMATFNVIIKNNKSQLSDYEPNYFTASVLALFERVLARLDESRRLDGDGPKA